MPAVRKLVVRQTRLSCADGRWASERSLKFKRGLVANGLGRRRIVGGAGFEGGLEVEIVPEVGRSTACV